MTAVGYLLGEYDEAAWNRFNQCFDTMQSPVSIIGDDLWTAMKFLVSPDDKTFLAWLEEKSAVCTPIAMSSSSPRMRIAMRLQV